MSYRNSSLRERVPYPSSFNRKHTYYDARSSIINTPQIPSTSESGDAEEDEEDRFKPSSDITSSERLSRSFLSEDDIETDIPFEYSDDHRFSTLTSYESLRHREYPLLPYYIPLPGLLEIPGPSLQGLESMGSRRLLYSTSPAVSIESVLMDLDSEDRDFRDPRDFEDIPTEEVEDETDGTLEGTEESEEFVNVRVKVEKKEFLKKAMKVTVSVQPPSEVEDDIPSDHESEQDSNESSESEGISESVEDEIDEETDEGSESGEESEEDDKSGENDTENQKPEDSKKIAKTETISSVERPSKYESEPPTIEETSEPAQAEDEREDEAEIIEENDAEEGKVEVETVIAKDEPVFSEEAKEDIEEGDKTLDLLSAAIKDSETSKLRIIEQAEEKIREAEALAKAEAEKALAQVPVPSPKGLGGSMISGIERGVSSAIGSVRRKAPAVEEEMKTSVQGVQGKLGESLTNVEKEVKETFDKGTEKLTDTANVIDKRIHDDASKAVEKVTETGKSVLGLPSSSSVVKESPSKMIEPPSSAIVVANVIVHGAPKDNSNSTNQAEIVLKPEIVDQGSNIRQTAEEELRAIEAEALEAMTLESESQLPSPTEKEKSVKKQSKSEERDEYLTVYNGDSMDSSDDDEDKILDRKKTKEETEEERRAVELAKDKLMEDWKSTRRQSIENLDETFPHILEDMISEMTMEPVAPFIPRKLKEAVQESEEAKKDSPSSAKSRETQSQSSIRQLTDEEFMNPPSPSVKSEASERMSTPKSVTPSAASRSSSHTNSSQKSRNLSKQNSVDSRQSITSAGSVSSRRSSKPIVSPTLSQKSKLPTPSKIVMPKPPTPVKVIPTGQISNVLPQSTLRRNSSAQPLKVRLPPSPSTTTKPVLARTRSTSSLKVTSASPHKSANPAKADGETNNIPRPPSKAPLSRNVSQSSLKVPASNASLQPLPSPAKEGQSMKVDESKMVQSSESEEIVENLSISRHSSFQSDQSIDLGELEPSLANPPEGESDLPNFYTNSPIPEAEENSESDGEGREVSPSQRRKWKNTAEIASTLSHYLHIVKTETVENGVSEIIPLLTQLLVMNRKNKTEYSLPTLIATLSCVRVLCERLHHVKIMSGERALKNMDLSWLLRILCKLSADPECKLMPEASFTLAKLVKAAGPELVTRPVYFLLVMEGQGTGHKKSGQGSKTKAAVLDTLTYALLSFPKDDFDDLEEIARWVCIVSLHPHRRVRQAAMECLAVIGHHLGSPDAAVSRLRSFIVHESAEVNHDHSDSDGSTTGKQKSAIRTFDGNGIFDVSAITAISHRLRKRRLPLPSPYGLIEYGVKVPTGQELVVILTKMQEEEEEEYEFSTSDESIHASEDDDLFGHSESEESIRMSDLEKAVDDEKHKKSKAHAEPAEEKDKDLITPDVAYILAGKGRVRRQEEGIEEVPEEGEDGAPPEDSKEKRKKAMLKKKRMKRRQAERTYSEYEDDSPEEN